MARARHGMACISVLPWHGMAWHVMACFFVVLSVRNGVAWLVVFCWHGMAWIGTCFYVGMALQGTGWHGMAWHRLFSSVWARPAWHPPHVLPCIYDRAAACPSRSCSRPHPIQLAKMALTAALQSQANAILASDEAANDKMGKLNRLSLQHGLAAYQTQVPEKFLVHLLNRGGAVLNAERPRRSSQGRKAHPTRLAARPDGNLCGGFCHEQPGFQKR